jgi:hypothetical protein
MPCWKHSNYREYVLAHRIGGDFGWELALVEGGDNPAGRHQQFAHGDRRCCTVPDVEAGSCLAL